MRSQKRALPFSRERFDAGEDGRACSALPLVPADDGICDRATRCPAERSDHDDEARSAIIDEILKKRTR